MNRESQLGSWASLAGGLSAALGLLVLVGWYTHTVVLVQLFPTLVPMQFNTALGFLLCGAGLLSLVYGRLRPAMACGGVVAIIGLLTLVEYAWGVDLGIDQLLMKHYVTVKTSHPGRMAPNTAISFLLSGAALLSLTRSAGSRWNPLISRLLGISIATLGFSSLFGYIAGVESAYGWGQLTRMAAHTAIGFALLGTGVFVFAWRKGGADEAGGTHHISGRRRLAVLSLVMITIVIGVMGVTLFALYETAFKQERLRLVGTAQSQARLIEAIARFDAVHSTGDVPGGAFEATLGQIREAHARFEGIGETGEFTLAQRQGDQIVFLLRHRHHDVDEPDPVHFFGKRAEPMRRALSGKSGTIIARDYRGEMVLAAHEPVAVLDLGIVAKIDLTEIRAPFIRAGMAAGGVAVALVLLGAGLFLRIGNPLLRRIEESERKYRALFESASEGVGLLEGGVYVDCNDQMCRLWACEREDIIGHSPLDFSPPTQPDGRDSAEAINELVEAALSGKPQFFSWKHRRKDGVRLDMEVALKSVEIDGRRLVLGSVRDVTEREQAQRRFRSVTESAYDAIITADSSGNIVSWNKAAQTIFGYQGKEVLGKSLTLLMPERFRDAHQRGMNRHLATGESKVVGRMMQLTGLRKAGDEFPLELSISSWEAEGERFFTGIIRDTTDRVRAHQQLRLQGAALEAAANAIVITNRDADIVWLNPAFTRLTGYSEKEILGKNPRVLNSGKQDETFYRNLWKTILSGETWYDEHLNRRKDGSFYPVDQTITPLYDERGEISHFISVMQDITTRKQTEDEIRRLNVGLEQRVAERTRELQAAIEDLESFSYSVSHDLRAPLRHIDGFSRILLEEAGPGLDPTTRHYFQRIRDGAQQMGRLIDDLLNLARLGRTALSLQETPLGELVEETLKEMGDETEGRRIKWQIGPLPTLRCDPGLMKLVFTNLLSNAAKYTRPREQAVIVVGQTRRNGRTAIFVRDNGVGFNMKHADKLFGVFRRLHRDEEFEGTGVGLATVQRIIHKHGGQVWVEAEPDRGATFYFTLKGSGIKEDWDQGT